MRALVVLGLLSLTTSGCHARFKKNAPLLGTVKEQTLLTGGPFVNLGGSPVSGGGLIGLAATAVDVVQAVRSYDQTRDFASRVDPRGVNQGLSDGFAAALGDGPPFAYDPNAKALLQIEVLSYGLYAPVMGAPGRFVVQARIRGYDAQGKTIYKSSTSCDTSAGSPDGVAAVLGFVDNTAQLDKLSDEQLQATFDDMATWCGAEMVRKLRKHAG